MTTYQAERSKTIDDYPADSDLLKRIGIALTIQQRFACGVILVAVQGGVVTLQGNLPTYHDRQLIVAVTRHVAGVLRVNDELAIAEPTARKSDAVAIAEFEPSQAVRGGSKTDAGPAPNAFLQIPTLNETLEDRLAFISRSSQP